MDSARRHEESGGDDAEQRGIMPQPPEVARRIRLRRVQWIGMPLIALLPVLGLAGVFGESRAASMVAAPSFTLEADYPARFRYKLQSELRLTVRASQPSEIDDAALRISRAYLDDAGAAKITPEPSRIDGEDYVIELGDIPAGESRTVEVLLSGDRFGVAAGVVRAASGEEAPVALKLRSLIFP